MAGKAKDKFDFNALVSRIQTTSDALRQEALVVINRCVTARAWLTGFYIVEYEQHGRDRAEYGAGLLKRLAKAIGDANFALASLKNYRSFYLSYPGMAQPIAEWLEDRFGKGYTVSGFLHDGASTPKGYTPCSLSSAGQILVENDGVPSVSPWALFNRLSYSHIREIVRVPDGLQRTFYAFEAIRGTWSVRELKRQIASQYYQRCGWNGNPGAVSLLTQKKAEKASVKGFIKTDAVLEFLNLKPADVWSEKDLEDGIIGHLRDFILEMGLGFCFEARQKKILIDDAYEKVDLVFYHRILKCHVLVELKSKKFSYSDAAQLSVYMAYYRKHVCEPDDNPPVGILLCTEVGREMAEYVNTFIDPQLFVSKYQLQLPPKEKIAEFLRRENAESGSSVQDPLKHQPSKEAKPTVD